MKPNIENDFDMGCPNLPDNRVSFLMKYERTAEGLKSILKSMSDSLTIAAHRATITYESRLKGVDVDERS